MKTRVIDERGQEKYLVIRTDQMDGTRVEAFVVLSEDQLFEELLRLSGELDEFLTFNRVMPVSAKDFFDYIHGDQTMLSDGDDDYTLILDQDWNVVWSLQNQRSNNRVWIKHWNKWIECK